MSEPDPDILRAARSLIEFYGANAEKVAEQRASRIASPGDSNAAAATWHRISEMVRTLQHSRDLSQPRNKPAVDQDQ